jgi:hypothetical protein
VGEYSLMKVEVVSWFCRKSSDNFEVRNVLNQLSAHLFLFKEVSFEIRTLKTNTARRSISFGSVLLETFSCY